MKVKLKFKETTGRKDDGLNSSGVYQKDLRKINFDILGLE